MTMDITLIFAGVVFLAAIITGMRYRRFINSCRGRICKFKLYSGYRIHQLWLHRRDHRYCYRDKMCYLIRIKCSSFNWK